jgi:hypothetical protein
MILNILIAVLLLGLVAIAIAVYQLNKLVLDICDELELINEDICGLEDIVITRALTKKK